MIYSKIQKYCEENNITFVIGGSEEISKYAEVLNQDIPFINDLTIEERINPKCTLEQCKSIIVIGVPYEIYKSKKVIGVLSQNSYIDYHNVVRKHLEKISKIINLEDTVYSVDTGKLFERGFALEYGLGFRGLNTFVINKKYGTYFNIGYLVTSMEIEKSKNKSKTCYECYKCIDACPTKSLKDGNCNMMSCASYLTQKKGLLSYEEIQSIGNFLYGCDICQKVCPHNKGVKYINKDINISALEILDMSKKEFLKYKELGFYWRGLGVIKRNAIYNIFNSNMNKNEKIEIFKNRLHIEKMELPKKALEQVISILEE